MRYIRREVQGGAGAARNTGLAAASHALVACIDSDCVPRPGWLEALLPHFADPEVSAVAPRIVALDEGRGEAAARGRWRAGGESRGGREWRGGATRRGRARGRAGGARAARLLARYEADRSPLDRGPAAARVLPYGRVPFVPGAAIVVRRDLRFDETLVGGEDVEFVWRVPYVRYEPVGPGRARPPHGPARLAAAARLLRAHRGRHRQAPPGQGAAAACLAVDDRRLGRARRPPAAHRRRRSPPPRPRCSRASWTATRRPRPKLAAVGTLRSGRVVADALTRAWWPLSLAAAIAVPKARLPLAAACVKPPLHLADDLAYGYGLWRGCIAERTLDPLLPARPWKLLRDTSAPWSVATRDGSSSRRG